MKTENLFLKLLNERIHTYCVNIQTEHMMTKEICEYDSNGNHVHTKYSNGDEKHYA